MKTKRPLPNRLPGILVGLLALSLTAVPGALAAPFAYVSNFGSGNVSVIDGAINAVVTTVPVGTAPYGVAANPAGTRAYIANYGDNSISVIDTASNTLVATVPVGSPSLSILVGLAVSPSGSPVYVTNAGENTVSVIDAQTNAILATVPVGGSPFGVATDPTGARVFVGNDADGTVSVIDAATNAVVATVGVGAHPLAFGAFVAAAPSAADSCDSWNEGAAKKSNPSDKTLRPQSDRQQHDCDDEDKETED